MKTKFLFSALLGGALLASCSMDEDFDSKSVAQGINPSAPVFHVRFDNDDETRATMSAGKLFFNENDLLSLYHGITAPETEDAYNAELDDLESATYENAIYKGSYNSTTDAFTFTTQAMVKDGYAILIYPANTGKDGVHPKGNPVLTVDPTQNAETKEQTPYMTEWLHIGEWSDETNENVAGYNRDYDIVLKAVGSPLYLTLNKTAEVDLSDLDLTEDLTITKVELKAQKGNSTPFVTEVKVVYDDKLGNEGVPTANDAEKKLHTSWARVSSVTPVKGANVNAISTTDIENDVATFTLLGDANGGLTNDKYDIIISTNYGSKLIADPTSTTDETKLWHEETTTPNKHETILEGLNRVLTTAYSEPAATSTSSFKRENVGKAFKRTLDVNLTGLNFDGLHISSQEQLINVSKVMNKLGVTEEKTTLYLDGKNGEFVMDAEGIAAYEAILAMSSNENVIEFAPCDLTNEKCLKVVLKGTNAKVPANLLFAAKTQGNDGSTSVTDKFIVELQGSWILDGGKTYQNVDSLVVAEKAKLTLQGAVNALNPEATEETPLVAGPGLANRGEINVLSDVTLQLNTRNYGTINVGSETVNGSSVRLRMSGLDVTRKGTNAEVTLINEVLGKTIEEATRGEINLYSRLATVDNTMGKVINYGYIEMKNNDASVLLFANGTGDETTGESNFAKAFKNDGAGGDHSNDNIFGILKLNTTNNPLTTILESGKQGFVKYEDTNVGNSYTLINYIVLTGNCISVSQSVKYLEINTTNNVIDFNASTNGLSYTGLIVPQGKTVSIAAGKTVNVTGAVYLKGEVYRAGNFNVTKGDAANNYSGFVGYLHGEATDWSNVSSAGNSSSARMR